MPTESVVPADTSSSGSSSPSPPPPDLKCTSCGVCAPLNSNDITQDIVVLSDPIERICGSCVRNQEMRRQEAEYQLSRDPLGLGIFESTSGNERSKWDTEPDVTVVHGIPTRSNDRDVGMGSRGMTPEPVAIEPVPIPRTSPDSIPSLFAHSLPSQNVKPWKTALYSSHSSPPDKVKEGIVKKDEKVDDVLPNPLLDIAKTRMPNVGRGALYPGSIFKGTQTSGRSAYDVEVRFLDVNFPESTLSGYLSISHLTEAHPHLTTFFTAEIIGPKYGFITGAKYGATEHDDMRHWGRFEQFRRPSTRSDMIRPELFFRDPLPDRSRGEVKGKERDFVFLRIKERFLVPDHTVRDISGASFAGFYFAMVDLSPPPSTEPPSPTIPLKSPTLPSNPLPRRQSTDARSSSRPDFARRRQSSTKFAEQVPARGEATIRGYYFHSLNQEPFQELFLTHVPNRSSSTMELR